MRIETDSSTNTIYYYPDVSMHSASVILLHGLGDSGDGISDIAGVWSKTLPHVKFIVPTATSRPVTLNMGARMNAWYDIVGLDERSSETCDGILESMEKVRSLVEAEARLGIPYNRILLSGFSQGGAMALFTGLQMDDASKKLAGILVMSGYLAGAGMFTLTPGLETTPILHCHGTSDPVVKYQWAEKTRTGLKEKGVEQYDLIPYSGMGHTITNEVLHRCENFIQSLLPHDPVYIINHPKPPSEMTVKELKLAIRNAGLNSKAIGFTEKIEFIKLLEDHYAKKNLY